MSRPSLNRLLSRVRRRLVLIRGTSGLLWAMLAACLLVFVGVWLDLLWDLPPRLRIATLVLAGVVGLSVLGVLAARMTRSATCPKLARRLDEAGRTGGVVLSGWELACEPDRGVTGSPELTRGLAHLAVAQATDVAHRVPVSSAVAAQPLRRAGLAFAGWLAAVTLLAVCLPTLARTEWNRFMRPLSDVPPYAAVQFQVEPGDAEVVYGQGLDVFVRVTGGEVERVDLVLGGADAEVLPMFAEPDGRWRSSLARITEPTEYLVRSGRARSRRFHIGVITVPRIEAVRFRVTPPAYTNEAAYEGPWPKEGLAGLAGTRVEVWAKSNRPLSSGRVTVTGEHRWSEVALQPASKGDEEVHGEFAIRAAGKLELRVTDVAGQDSQESFAGTVTLLVDQRPLVRLIEPKPMSLATPSAQLPVAVAAEDDYGVARLQLFRSLNDSRPLPQNLPVQAPARRRWQDQLYLPLAAYGLAPGDEIKLFARVEDNDPAGAKGSESRVVTVRIISQEEFERLLRVRQGLEVLMSKYQQAERRMASLAEELDKARKQLESKDKQPAEPPAAAEARETLQRMVEQLRRDSRELAQAAQHLLPYDLDRNLTEQLQRLADELDAAARDLENALAESSLTDKELAERLAKLAARLAARRQQFQAEALLPLEHLAKIYPLIEDQSRFVLLVLRQRDLADRLAAMKGQDGVDDPPLKARMRELEEEQRALREELNQLLDDIENHVAQLPDEEPFEKLRETALKFVAAVRGSGAAEAMSEAENALSEFAGTRAHEKASEAADILERFLSLCEGMVGQCQGCLVFNPSLAKCLGDTVAQLLQEAGLGMGMGTGAGGGAGLGPGNGFSARRSPLGNMGLYGGLPGLGPQFGDQGLGPAGAQADAPGSLGGDGSNDPALVEAAATGQASGSAQGTIPARYRQRVGQYFQRIAEEASE